MWRAPALVVVVGVLSSAVALAAFGGCSLSSEDPTRTTGADTGAPVVCTPGEARACTCSDRAGSQTCVDDGTRYSTCMCGVPDTGPAPTDSYVPPDTADAGCSLGGYAICNPRDNCGCKGALKKCDWLFAGSCGFDAPSCGDAGSNGTGARCSLSSDCDRDHTCFELRCQKKGCASVSECGAAGQWHCAAVATCDGKSSVPVCANKCLMSDPYACGFSGDGCRRVNLATSSITTCGIMGKGVVGATCKSDGDCLPGSFCAADTRCTRWCDATKSTDCPSGQSCRTFSDGTFFLFDGEVYGYCG